MVGYPSDSLASCCAMMTGLHYSLHATMTSLLNFSGTWARLSLRGCYGG